MNRILLFVIFALLQSGLLGATIKYPVFEIPEELKTGSNAVIREYKIVKEIVSPSLVKSKTTFAVTIFNKSGDFLGNFREYYDGQSSVNFCNITIYNSLGISVDKSKYSDFKDHLAYDGSLFNETHVIECAVNASDYPFTVEYTFDRTEKQTMNLEAWDPVPGYEVSIQHALLLLTKPTDFELRVKEENLQSPGRIIIDGKKTIYSWELSNYQALKHEPFMPKDHFYPMVRLAANNCEYDGVACQMMDWKSLGGWIWNLNYGRDVLSEPTIEKLKKMVEPAKTDREKIEILYKYLQDNTRYVSVQLGIGGYQPFRASDVDEQKYGDCKALSNYMYSMLKAIGIYSEYTVIRAFRDAPQIDTGFVCQQMNHIILCVPNQGDTIWLECTSQRQPFGFLGSFTDDRFALLIAEDGGKIVRTPHYTRDKNTLISKVDMAIDGEGNVSFKSVEKASTLQYENFEPFFYLDAVEQKKALYNNLNINNLTINNYSFDKTDGPFPTATRKLDASISRYGTINGQRLMFAPKAIDRFSAVLENIKDRKYPIVYTSDFTDYDTINITIPTGYKVEFLPSGVDLKNDFGEFKSQVVQEGNQLHFTRYYTRWKGTYEPAKYAELRDFYKKMIKADENKVVLIKEQL